MSDQTHGFSMEWTKDLPSEEGYYWLDYSGERDIVKIERDIYTGNLMVWFYHKDEDYPYESYSLYSYSSYCRWAGPIPLPKEK